MKRALIFALFSTGLYAQSYRGDVVKKSQSIAIHLDMNSIAAKSFDGPIPFSTNLSTIAYSNWPVNNTVGAPKLPFQSFILKGDLKSVQIKLSKGEVVKLNETPMPELQYPCRCDKKTKGIQWVMDKRAYENEGALYDVTDLGDFRGEHLLRLNVYPFQVERGELAVYPDLKVDFDGAEWMHYTASDRIMLIAGTSSFLAEIEALKAAREAQGFTVHLLKLDGINTNVAKIKSEISKAYQKLKFTHAIILGDENVVAMDKMKTSSSDETPSDLPYFLMGGSNDTVPDVFFGRFPAANSNEVKSQVQKVLSYDQATQNHTHSKKMLGIASDEGANPSDVEYMEEMMKPFQTYGYSFTRVYQGNANHKNKDIADAIDSGVSWINYIGHGSGYSWVSVRDKQFMSAQIKDLKNTKEWPVIVDVACQNGRQSGDGRFGETMMKATDLGNNPIGAAAFYGGTVDISWHPPAVMAVGINQILSTQKKKELGALLFEGQLHLIKNWRNADEALENWRWYSLMGDPSMQIDLF